MISRPSSNSLMKTLNSTRSKGKACKTLLDVALLLGCEPSSTTHQVSFLASFTHTYCIFNQISLLTVLITMSCEILLKSRYITYCTLIYYSITFTLNRSLLIRFFSFVNFYWLLLISMFSYNNLQIVYSIVPIFL